MSLLGSSFHALVAVWALLGQAEFSSKPPADPDAPRAAAQTGSVKQTFEPGADNPFDEPQEATEYDPIEQGRDALDQWGRYPWYDSSADDFHVPRPENLPAPQQPQNFTPTATAGASDPFSVLGWVLVILVLALLAALLVWFFSTREGSDLPQSTAARHEISAEQIEALPQEVRRGAGDLLGEARRLANEGRYEEAIVFLYSHILVALDRTGRIKLAKGKTNRQYLRELRQRDGLYALVDQTMVAFEDAFFGKHQLASERFMACWNQLSDFDRWLVPAEAAA